MKIPPESVMFPGRGVSIKGSFYTRWVNGKLVVSKWPRRQISPRTPDEADKRKLLAAAARATAYMSPGAQAYARQIAKVSKLLPRDLLMIALFNRLGYVVTMQGRKIFSMPAVTDVSNLLDAINQIEGGLLVRGKTWWEGLAIGTPGQVLTVNPDGDLEWMTPGGGGGGGGIGAQLSKQSGNQAVASFTHVALDWDTTDYSDTGFTVDLTANTITVLDPGYYLINVYTQFTAATQMQDFISIERNGTVMSQGPQANRPAALSSQLTCIVPCAANDVLQAFIDSSAVKTLVNTASVPGKMLFQVNKV